MERDPRAIAVSVYHHFRKTPKTKEYLQKCGLHDLDTFAKFFFEGKFFFGDPVEYNQCWRNCFKSNKNLNVLQVKYEGEKTNCIGYKCDLRVHA